jgi:hypothetical protein
MKKNCFGSKGLMKTGLCMGTMSIFIVLVMVEEKNNIVFLEDGDKKIFGDENILEHATQYYVELFGPTPGNLLQIDMEVWNGLEKLDDTDNQILCGKISEKEIKEALFQMESNKAAD